MIFENSRSLGSIIGLDSHHVVININLGTDEIRKAATRPAEPMHDTIDGVSVSVIPLFISDAL